jgi:hypothetical protein
MFIEAGQAVADQVPSDLLSLLYPLQSNILETEIQTAARVAICTLFGKVTDRPSKTKQCRVLEFRYSVYANEGVAPIRCAGAAAGVMSGPGNGLHGSQCGNEHPRARLLPHDEEPVWPDGDAGVAWLLPEESAECSR